MSWGYVPKKLKRARRYRLLRKKYKNFSCKTCRYPYICMKSLGKNVEFCPNWKASLEAKRKTKNDLPAEKKTKKRRRFFKSFIR